MKPHTVLIILVVIAALAVFSFMQVFNNSEEVDAKKFFEEDLAQSYPDADVLQILSTKKVDRGYGEYYVLKARVSSGLDTPCPERLEVEYNYPSRNFVKADEKVVYGCQVCLEQKQNCHIVYMEEAIIASHTFDGTQKIGDFIQQYPTATPNVQFLDEFNNKKNVWEVTWSQPQGDRIDTISVYISQNDKEIIQIIES